MEKVVLHAHSNWSHDSNLSLCEWRDFLISTSLNAVYLTEHEESGWDSDKYNSYKLECERFSCEEYKIVPGLELNINGYHVLAPALFSYEGRPSSLREISIWAHANETILILAHPTKYKKIEDNVLSICDGIEIRNTKPQYNWIFGSDFRTISILKKYKLIPYMGQDIHKFKQFRQSGVSYIKDGIFIEPDFNDFRWISRVNSVLIYVKNLLIRILKWM